MSEDSPVVVLVGFAESSRLQQLLEPLSLRADVRISQARSSEDVAHAIADAHVVITRAIAIDDAAMVNADHLVGIVVNGIGVDFVDLDATRRRGVPVANTPVFAQSVAEGTLLLLMAVARRYNELDRMVRRGERADSSFRGTQIVGKTLGLVGMGRVASELISLMSGFDMEFVAYDPEVPVDVVRERGARPGSLEDVLAAADFVCVLCPLIDATYHLISTEQFSLMQESAILVNTARGPIVDEAALIQALRTGEIAGAALDVFESEPPAVDNPLLSMDNVVAWPHRAPATWETYDRVSLAAFGAARAFLDGEEPDHPVAGEY